MARPSQGRLPPARPHCLSCGSHHVFPGVVETAKGRELRLKCLDCGWYAAEPYVEPEPEHPPRRDSAREDRRVALPLAALLRVSAALTAAPRGACA
jgi:hypothetical protein